jgi:hypothetical protein
MNDPVEFFYDYNPPINENTTNVCDVTAATIIVSKEDDDESIFNQTAATIIVNPDGSEQFQAREFDQLYKEMAMLRQRNFELTQQIENMELRDESNNVRIQKLENTVSKLLKYVNTRGN